MPLGAELQVQWIGACIRHLVENGLGTVETTASAEAVGRADPKHRERNALSRDRLLVSGSQYSGQAAAVFGPFEGLAVL